jgi:hypothetical protein
MFAANAYVIRGRRTAGFLAEWRLVVRSSLATLAAAFVVLACAVVAPALAAAGVYHRAAAAGAVAVSAARPDPATRTFTVQTRGHATGVTVCDLSPATWCATARPLSALRWVAELPTGPVTVATAGGFPESVGMALGADAQFTVAAIVYQRSASRTQRFTGSYENS